MELKERLLKLFIYFFAVVGGTIIIGHFIQGWYQFIGGIVVGFFFWILVMNKLQMKPEEEPYDPVEPNALQPDQVQQTDDCYQSFLHFIHRKCNDW